MVLGCNCSGLRFFVFVLIVMAYGTITSSAGREIGLLANALTKYRYRQVFGEDLMHELQRVTERDASEQAELFEKLAYVMATQAEKTSDKASVEGFLDWLEQFESFELANYALDIIAIYQNNQKGLSEVKNQVGPQSVE